MNTSLPDTLKSFVDEQVNHGNYGTSSEYVRELANRDIDDAIAYSLSEGAEQAALGFIDTLEQAYAHIGRHPATGSPKRKGSFLARSQYGRQHHRAADRYRRPLLDSRATIIDGYLRWLIDHACTQECVNERECSVCRIDVGSRMFMDSPG